MKNFRWWPVIGLAVVSFALSGCGSGNDSSSSSAVRLVNATNTHASLDFIVDSAVSITGVASDTVSGYVAPAAGSTTLQINDTATGAVLSTTVPTLTGALHYAVIAYESGGVVQTAIVNEDFAVPALGSASLRLVDAAPTAGKLDVYITASTVTDLSSISTPTVSFTNATNAVVIPVSPASYTVWVTAAGNKTDVRMSMPVTVTNQQFADVVMTPASGGALLNGSFLLQQGAYTAARNANARVRLAAAVPGTTTKVTASASNSGATGPIIIDGSGSTDPGVVAPAFGFYVLVPAGTTQAPTSLNIAVGGNSVGAPATPLVAGSDYTLLVYNSGLAGSTGPVASLIADDNRPPTDSTTVKMRLINGITGNAGALTLTANSSPVGTAVTPGTASSYATVAGSLNAMNLVLTSSQASGVLLSNSTNVLSANTVYTVMAVGDVSAPSFLIR